MIGVVGLHIVMIAPEQFPVPGSGSVEICILSIAKKLANHHKVTILSRRSPHHGRRSHMGNVTIVRVPARRKRTYVSSVLRYLKKNRRFDFIQVDNRPHYMAKVKKAFPNTPVSLFLHSLTFVPKTSRVAASLKLADLIIANSTSLKSKVSRRFSSQKQKIRTVYLCADTSRFKPPSQAERMRNRKRYRIGRSFAILFVGRVIPRKGLPVLIKATNIVRRKVRKARLIIVGGGRRSYIRKLKSQARRLKVPAIFLGKIPHKSIHHLYQAADCFVCPSQRHEAFGLVNVEAMSTGVPVVASNIGGIKEIIVHGRNGYLVKNYRRPASFSRYILKIANKKGKAGEMSRRGRQSVKRRFSWGRTASHLSRLMRKIRRGKSYAWRN
jgi:spore coat protein SA